MRTVSRAGFYNGILTFLALLFSVAGIWIFGFSAHAQDVSTGKAYTLSPQPHYLKYSPEQVAHNLTDGVSTYQRMWTSDQALTWVRAPRVSISIDLEGIHAIDAISVNLAAGIKGQVNFPAHAYVYVSLDGKNYKFATDLMAGSKGLAGEDYVSKKFEKNGIREHARYVRLEVIPRGVFFSVDEIDIKGIRSEQADYMTGGHISALDVASDVEKRFAISVNKIYAEKDKQALKRLKFNRKSGDALQVSKSFGGASLVIESVSPWSDISPFAPPSESTKRDKFSYFMPVSGCLYRAYRFTDLSTESRSIRFKQDINDDQSDVKLFHVDVVRDSDGNLQYDPLIPVKGSITLSKEWSNLFLLKICDVAGRDAQFNVSFGAADSGERYLDVSGSLKLVDFDNVGKFNAVTWSYLTDIDFSKNAESAVDDLAAHHENAIVVPVTLLKSFPYLSDGVFEEYISSFDKQKANGKFTKIILFLGLRGKPFEKKPEWFHDFLVWYAKATAILRDHGWDESEVYLYPYDEPRDEDADAAKELNDWLRKTIPGVNVFLTINSVDSLSLQSSADIVAVVPALVDSLQIKDSTKIWLYGTSGSAKHNSIYGYYRLMPWRAFSYDMAGVGFWSYSDKGKSGWNDDYGGGRTNYSPVYFDESGRLLSSLRWEAWAQGLRDVDILRAAAGKIDTRDMALKIIKDNVSYGELSADSAIQGLLSMLREAN